MKKTILAVVISAVVIPTVALTWSHIGKVWAAPKEVEQVKETQRILAEQTTKIGEWIEQQEKENELRRKAPPGYQWNEATGEYILWPEDPRLPRKKGR